MFSQVTKLIFQDALKSNNFGLVEKLLNNQNVSLNHPVFSDIMLNIFRKNDYIKIKFISSHGYDIHESRYITFYCDVQKCVCSKFLKPIQIVDNFSKYNKHNKIITRNLCISYIAEQMLDKSPTLDCIQSMPICIFGIESVVKKMNDLRIEYKTLPQYIEFLSIEFVKAFKTRNLNVMKNILELGHDINMCYGTVLIDGNYCSFSGSTIEMAIKEISPEIIQFLIDNGANIPIEYKQEVLWQLRKSYIFLKEGISYYPNHVLFYLMNELIVKEVSSFYP